MNEDPTRPRADEDVEPGDPIESLSGFEHDASNDFMSRVRHAIQRRTTASQIASFSWNTPFLVFIEFWTTLTEHFFRQSARKDQRR
jgi:hypothetical protein